MKISVIVPIYKVEEYIENCIKSVLEQSYRDVELILVDDESPDSSPSICDMYAKRDKRIRVIHKKNGGLSDARNAGMKIACGDYIAFLDGDDFWDDTEALSRLVERLNITKADVLNFSYKKYYEDTGKKVPYFENISAMPINNKTKNKQLEYLTGQGLYIASACNKLIKREVLTQELEFKKGIFSEDIEWSARLLIYANTMDFICENFYCYRQRSGSITHTLDDKKCEDLCNNIIGCMKLIELSDKDEKLYIERYTAYQYGTFFMVQAKTQNNVRDCIECLANYKWILSYHCGNKKLLILHLFCKILGYKTTCKLIRLVYTSCK